MAGPLPRVVDPQLPPVPHFNAKSQFHWIRLARATKHPQVDPVYRQILELASSLRSTGKVRFPLSTDRYHETLRITQVHRRIDVAQVMALLSGYETMLQLDTLTLQEIEAAVRTLAGLLPSEQVNVFGYGVMHAFGRRAASDGFRVLVPEDVVIDEKDVARLTEQMRAVFRELMQDRFEWATLSGDPRVRPLDGSLRLNYDRRRAEFAAEERRRARLVHDKGLDPRKAAFAFALSLHVDGIVQLLLDLDLELDIVPFDTDPVGVIESVPTIHVLAELLTQQYRNPATAWKPGDWADMRTLCQGVVYCDAIAPDKHWADAVSRTGLPSRYSTLVLADKAALLTFLEGLDQQN
jgi:hypothetical protein